MKVTCETCKFANLKNGIGDCRFNPPTPIMIPTRNPMTGQADIAINAVFAPTSKDLWCGQYQLKLTTFTKAEMNGVQNVI